MPIPDLAGSTSCRLPLSAEVILCRDLSGRRGRDASPVAADRIAPSDDPADNGLRHASALREVALRLAGPLQILVQRHAVLIIRFRIDRQPVFEILRGYPLSVKVSPWAIE